MPSTGPHFVESKCSQWHPLQHILTFLFLFFFFEVDTVYDNAKASILSLVFSLATHLNGHVSEQNGELFWQCLSLQSLLTELPWLIWSPYLHHVAPSMHFPALLITDLECWQSSYPPAQREAWLGSARPHYYPCGPVPFITLMVWVGWGGVGWGRWSYTRMGTSSLGVR